MRVQGPLAPGGGGAGEAKPPPAVFRPVTALAALCLLAIPARAATLEQVRASGVLRCGAVERPGLAEPGEDGRPAGAALALCRALTIAVLGPGGRTELQLHDTAAEAGEALRHGEDRVSFLSDGAAREAGVVAVAVPGPVVFVAALTVLAQPGVDALSGRTVCFMNGSEAHQALEAWAARTRTPLVRVGYQEEGELHDAFDARRCDAIAGEAAGLRAVRAEAPGRSGAHLLPPLGVVPVRALTSATDGAWSALAGWALGDAVQIERDPGPWRATLPAEDLPGLRPGWEREAAAALGDRPAGELWPEGLLLPSGPR